MLGVAVGKAGQAELAAACAEQLRKLAPDDALAEQQLGHVLRAAGDPLSAWLVEKRLLVQRRLAIADHARVLREMRERDGVAAAFAAGNQALAYTGDEQLLAVMIELADELGASDRAAELRARSAARAAKAASSGESSESGTKNRLR